MDLIHFSTILAFLFPSNFSSNRNDFKSSKNIRKNNQNKIYPVKTLWIMGFLTLFTAVMLIIIFSTSSSSHYPYRKAPMFRNAPHCTASSLVHVSMALDIQYLRGSIAAAHSILTHSTCPENIFFHFLIPEENKNLKSLIQFIFPELKFKFYYFNPKIVKNLISNSVRQALEEPLNYARTYLADLLETSIHKIIYLDSDLITVDDILNLWRVNLENQTIGAPEYCHTNFTNYFTEKFWTDARFNSVFNGRKPCYFNTGVMVMDLVRWRRVGYTKQIEKWMRVQKRERIYELGSLPPFLLVFGGHVARIDHRWNQHGLGGDNVKGSCRELHPGPVSLLHWSGSGKPWVRLDEEKPCPIDFVWARYDLYGKPT